MSPGPSLNAADLQQMMRSALDHSERAQLAHRLHCVLLVAQGHDCRQVSDWFDVSQRTVQRWVHLAAVHGVSGLLIGKSSGRPGVLNAQQRRRILDELQGPPQAVGCADGRWSGKRLAQRLSQVYGVSVSVRSCQRLIAQSRPRAGRQDF